MPEFAPGIQWSLKRGETLDVPMLALIASPRGVDQLRQHPLITELCAVAWDVQQNLTLGDSPVSVEYPEWFLIFAAAMYVMANGEMELARIGYRSLIRHETTYGHTSAAGRGLAFPHYREFGRLDPPFAILLAEGGYPYGAPDGNDVDVAYLFMRNAGRQPTLASRVTGAHVEVLSRFIRESRRLEDIFDLMEEVARDPLDGL